MFRAFCFCALISFNSDTYAQKLQIKAIDHERYEPVGGQLQLVEKNKKEFNGFNKLSFHETYKPNPDKKLELVRQVRMGYDPKGRHQNTMEYDQDGLLLSEIKLYWDSYNNKSKVEHINYDQGQRRNVTVTYQLKYNDDGDKESEQYYDNMGNAIRGSTWFYNSKKEVEKSYTWEEDKKSPRKEKFTSYKRDKEGDLIQSTTVEKVNGKEFRKDIRYFSDNYVVEWLTYIDGKLQSHFINEYRDSVIIRTTRRNKRQVLTLEEAAKEKERIERRIDKKNKRKEELEEEDIFMTNTEYDAYGNILVSAQSKNDKVIMVTQYTYDDYGNPIKIYKVDKVHDSTETELLEYDDWGNISKRTLKKNGNILSQDRYIYMYFDREWGVLNNTFLKKIYPTICPLSLCVGADSFCFLCYQKKYYYDTPFSTLLRIGNGLDATSTNWQHCHRHRHQ